MRTILLAGLVLSIALDAGAHDFWLAADPSRPAAGARVIVTANVGEHYPEATNFTAPERVDLWRIIGEGGDVTVRREFRRERDSLATDVVLAAPGAYLAVMTIQPRVADMKGPEFTDYLREEGLDFVIAARQSAGQSDAPGRERYARYAKVVIRNGDGSGTHLTRPVGLKAELVPAADPSSLRAGDALTVRLLAEGKPVGGALLTAYSAAAAGERVTGRTDRDGKATLKLGHPGAWLVRTVHMARTSEPGSPPADWESSWATLVFAVADGR